MANPQPYEFTKISNEIMDALMRTNFTAHERRILDCILRQTYGWNKKTDRISYSQFQTFTGIDHRHIGRSLKLLKERNIITCSGTGYSLEYGLQKDYDKWNLTPSEAPIIDTKQGTDLPPSEALIITENLTHLRDDLTHLRDSLPPSEAPNLTPSEAHTKEIKHLTKETIQKKEYGEFQNVLLTDEELSKLKERFPGGDAERRIEYFSGQLASKGYKYKSHYATILTWSRNDNLHANKKDGQNGQYKTRDSQLTTTEEIVAANERYMREHGG